VQIAFWGASQWAQKDRTKEQAMHRHFDNFMTAVIAGALLSAAPPETRVGPRSRSKSSKKRSLSQKSRKANIYLTGRDLRSPR
jgi:hypothetical protein